MVRRALFIFLIYPYFLFSGEFTASVDHDQVDIGESFSLILTLKDATAKKPPSTDRLQKEFSIHSQQQSYNTVIVNGKITSSTTWKLTLIPLKEGDVVIPAINVDSSEGVLTSRPITLQVVKTTGSSTADALENVVIKTELSNTQPYKNEPFTYTVNILSKKDLADIQVQKIDLENAIIELNEEPRVFRKVVDGVNVNIIEFNYLITPLKAGSLTIPSTMIKGVMPIKNSSQLRSFFNDDPFAFMQGFNQFKPFALNTEETVLTVQPAVTGMTAWLPAQSISIEESWNPSQTFRVGEPLSRGFKIVAEGIKSSQLPSVSDQQPNNDWVKTYADKPELGNVSKNGRISSFREEKYTLIPQQPGELILPGTSVEWWDVTKKEKVVTATPARTLHILPAIAVTVKEDLPVSAEVSEAVIQRDPILYMLIGGLLVLLFIAIVWGISLQRKILGFRTPVVDPTPIPKPHAKQKAAKSDKKEELPDLNPT